MARVKNNIPIIHLRNLINELCTRHLLIPIKKHKILKLKNKS